jgi:ribonuclease VapC
MSAVSWLEAHMVMSSRSGPQGGALVDTFVRESGVRIVAFDAHHAQAALSAWDRFGKGRHPAGLNLADCCAYAAAILEDQPLLFKGEDFSRAGIAAVDW